VLAVLCLALGAAGIAARRQPVVSVLADRLGSLLSGARNPYDDRPAIWRAAVGLWSERPALGVGPGGYPVLAARDGPLSVSAPLHAHSLLLTVGSEQGLVGLAALLGVIAAAVRSVARARTAGGPGEEVLAGAAAALTALLGQGLVDYPLRNPVLATLVWLLVGLLAAAAAAGYADEAFAAARPERAGFALRSARKMP
jgi:O-antigen ligase